MKILALIPGRSGSKGIIRKNIRDFCQKPLIQYSIELALSVREIDDVVVTTDDVEIAAIAEACGATVPFLRPKELSLDDTPMIDVVTHALDHLPEYEWVLLLQPTSPLRTKSDCERIIELAKNKSMDSIVSVSGVSKHPFIMFEIEAESGKMTPFVRNAPVFTRRQDLRQLYVPNGAFFMVRVSWVKKNKIFFGEGSYGYITNQEASIDIDDEFDWSLAEYIYKSKE